MFAPVKLSMEIRPPGNPRWAAEWQAPDGRRIAGFGDSPNEACADMATRAMRNMAGAATRDPESDHYFHPELALT